MKATIATFALFLAAQSAFAQYEVHPEPPRIPRAGQTIPDEQPTRPQPQRPSEERPQRTEPREKESIVINDVVDFFGEAGEGAARAIGKLVHQLFSKLGVPTGVIKGEEAGGAFAVGLRYGEGQLNLGGKKSKLYWRGPSIGFDIGGNYSKVYMLVYKARKTSQVYERFGAVEGSFYFVAGAGTSVDVSANAYNAGDVVLVPIRVGLGLRQGVNVNYLAFTPEREWFPF